LKGALRAYSSAIDAVSLNCLQV